MSDLKRCPFCGGEACVYDKDEHDQHKTECLGCGCSIITNYDKEYAVKNWNQRANSKALQRFKDIMQSHYHNGHNEISSTWILNEIDLCLE